MYLILKSHSLDEIPFEMKGKVDEIKDFIVRGAYFFVRCVCVLSMGAICWDGRN